MRNTLAAWSKLFSIKLELIGVEIFSLVFDVAVCEWWGRKGCIWGIGAGNKREVTKVDWETSIGSGVSEVDQSLYLYLYL